MLNLNLTTTKSGASAKILNIAHRGARAFAPENTLVGFAKAKAFGCDMFELDVRLSKDGEIVVYHDEELIRCTNAKTQYPHRSNYKVSDFTYAELSRLDAGSWYVEQLMLAPESRQPFLQSLTANEIAEFINVSEQAHYASGDIKIPTLSETLSLAKDLSLLVNIELKKTDDGSALVVAVVKLVQSMQMESQILISSFEHDLLSQVRQHTKTIATAILTDTPIKAPITYLRKFKANAYNLGCYKNYNLNGFKGVPGKRFLNYTDKLKKAGFSVNIWTCNNPQEMADLLVGGMTGLISDYPNRVREIINYGSLKH